MSLIDFGTPYRCLPLNYRVRPTQLTKLILSGEIRDKGFTIVFLVSASSWGKDLYRMTHKLVFDKENCLGPEEFEKSMFENLLLARITGRWSESSKKLGLAESFVMPK